MYSIYSSYSQGVFFFIADSVRSAPIASTSLKKDLLVLPAIFFSRSRSSFWDGETCRKKSIKCFCLSSVEPIFLKLKYVYTALVTGLKL